MLECLILLLQLQLRCDELLVKMRSFVSVGCERVTFLVKGKTCLFQFNLSLGQRCLALCERLFDLLLVKLALFHCRQLRVYFLLQRSLTCSEFCHVILLLSGERRCLCFSRLLVYFALGQFGQSLFNLSL